MNLKLLRNSLLVCGALTASGFAFADVVLNNGAGTVSWDDFAAVINGTKTVEGDTVAFKKNNPTNASVVALADANTAYEAAQEAAKTTKADSASAATRLADAKKDLAPYTANITEAEDALSKAEAQLAQWNTEYDNYSKEATSYANQLTSLMSQVSSAERALTAAQKAYDACGTTSTDTKKVYKDWLQKAYENFETFNEAYDKKEASGQIWCYYDDTDEEEEKLYVAFTPITGYTELDAVKFRADYVTKTTRKPVEFLYINYGSTDGNFNYTASKNGIQSLTDYGGTGSATRIVTTIEGGIQKAMDNPSFYSTIVTTNTIYDDPDGKLKEAVDDAQAKVNSLTEQQDAANASLTTANKNVADTQEKIDGYTKPVAPAEKSQQQTLQDAVETAKNAATDAEAAVTSAQDAYDKAVAESAAKAEAATAAEAAVKTAEAGVQTAANNAAKENYNRITLNSDIEATAAITADTFSGTILGNGYVITNKSGSTLFDAAKGGKRALPRIADWLEQCSFAGTVDIAKSVGELPIKGPGVTILISDFLQEPFLDREQETLKKLLNFLNYRKQRTILLHVLAKEELTVELTGTRNLIDMEDQSTLRLTLDAGSIRTYEKALQEFTDRLRRECAGAGAFYAVCSTGTDIYQLIFQDLRMLYDI